MNIIANVPDLIRVHGSDHVYTTVKLPMDCTVHQVISHVKRKLCLSNDLILCEVRSTGGRYTNTLSNRLVILYGCFGGIWPHPVFIWICFKFTEKKSLGRFQTKPGRFPVWCRYIFGHWICIRSNIARQISNKTYRILFDVGIFSSLIDGDTGLELERCRPINWCNLLLIYTEIWLNCSLTSVHLMLCSFKYVGFNWFYVNMSYV